MTIYGTKYGKFELMARLVFLGKLITGQDYRAFFPVCRKVWKRTFWKVPSADTAATYCQGRPSQIVLKLMTKLFPGSMQNIATDGKKCSVD